MGSNIKKFEAGDEVFRDLCECDFSDFGEYICAPEAAYIIIGPGGMRKMGFSRDIVAMGGTLTIHGNLARNPQKK